MSLYSLTFFFFLLIAFILYWRFFKKTAYLQNVLLTAASVFFCGWADIRFLALLLFSTVFNFYTAQAIYGKKNDRSRRYLLYAGVMVNVLLLIYYKYFNFFYKNIAELLGLFEKDTFQNVFEIISPIGVSFFTFQAIGYIIDVYREDIEPCGNLLTFATFITYFPKMTAGPIERAGPFFAQVQQKRVFNYSLGIDGLRQILWGSFVKLVVSNNCASICSGIFDNYDHLPASTLLAGAFFYVFQVYCDFSGYSNIAIGISKLFGIQLMRNFAAPFFSTTIRDYWKKWHISLSSWMMHYVFTPLSFTLRRYGKMGLIISIIVTFLIIGIWHGPKWTFIVFGLMHGLYFIPSIIAGTATKSAAVNKRVSLKSIFQMAGLFVIIMLTLVIFGSDNLSQAFHYLNRMLSSSLFSPFVFPEQMGASRVIATGIFIFLMMTVEWLQKDKAHEMHIDNIKNPLIRFGIYYSLLIAILLFGSIAQIKFLYSQF